MILKLPATLTKIGDGAFAKNLIRDLEFATDPSAIAVGTDAFKQLEARQVSPSNPTSMVPIPSMNNEEYAVASDVLIYREYMDNPYLIKVNGQPVSYAQFIGLQTVPSGGAIPPSSKGLLTAHGASLR